MKFACNIGLRLVLKVGLILGVLVGCEGSCPAGTIRDGSACRRSQSTAQAAAGDAASGPIGSSNSAPATDERVIGNAAGSMVSATSAGGIGASEGMANMPAIAGSAATFGRGGAAGTSAKTCSSSGPEICDNIDNDCDNAIDENLRELCGMNLGACKSGERACRNGAWSDCTGNSAPSAELCDAAMLDENCNGMANENCACTPGMTQPCGSNQGVCRPGVMTCSAEGTWPLECSGEVKGGTEICDAQNLDEDCDGNPSNGCECVNDVQEPCDTGKLGVCAAGTRSCSGGKWSACRQTQTAQAEVCDTRNLDEDCDGNPNTGCECTSGMQRDCTSLGHCVAGQQLCMNGRWGSCSSKACSPSEMCAVGVCRPRDLPSGTYRDSCDDCTFDGITLRCPKCEGGSNPTSINPLLCLRDITNCLGTLKCDMGGFAETDIPPGSYKDTCKGCRREFCGTRLVCEFCSPGTTEVSLMLPCPGNTAPENIVGVLQCTAQ